MFCMFTDYPSVSVIIPRTKGGYVVTTTHNISYLENWESGKLTVCAEIEQGQDTQINDGKCDLRGRLWAGEFKNRIFSFIQ